MSDFDDMGFDEDELADMYDDPDMLTPEEVFKMCFINKAKKTTVRVELQDKDGDTVDLPDTIAELVSYINKQLKDENGNQFTDQIMPLMAQAMVSGLGRTLGIRTTAFYLAQPLTQRAFIEMMCISFLLLKFVQSKGLLLHTYEEEVTDEEIEAFERKSRANDVAVMGSFMGVDPKETLKAMLDEGQITADDLQDLAGDIKIKGDDEDGEAN